MYPVFRLAYQVLKHKNDPKIPFTGTFTSTHICWPWDIDIWWELNNGRTLTLYDMGRIPLAMNSGLWDALRKNKWGLTVAGSCPRYRRRVRVFDKVTLKSRAIGWDDKFIYIEQSMWKTNGDCASHALLRTAVTDKNGIVSPEIVAREIGFDGASPELPAWVEAWIDAEKLRPWPPMQDATD